LRVASVSGLIAVAAGAFGAHALKDRLEPSALNGFEVAVRYQMYHALAMLAVAWVGSTRPSRRASAAGWAMLIGTVLFCGSLYGLTLGGWRWLGPVTPLGGVSFMVGWLLLALSAGSPRRSACEE
jgi:uncharacterized membrane protein YgdD (TMEM256/DUF423 family)